MGLKEEGAPREVEVGGERIEKQKEGIFNRDR